TAACRPIVSWRGGGGWLGGDAREEGGGGAGEVPAGGEEGGGLGEGRWGKGGWGNGGQRRAIGGGAALRASTPSYCVIPYGRQGITGDTADGDARRGRDAPLGEQRVRTGGLGPGYWSLANFVASVRAGGSFDGWSKSKGRDEKGIFLEDFSKWK